MRTITHFSVGNGNCSVIEAEDFVMIIDLNKTEDKESSYELLKPFFRDKDGTDCIDVLYITHGDEDHCLGFKKFKEELDNDSLIIGSIWHQDYDRTINEKKKDLPKDYLELQDEINRRKEIDTPEFGDIQKALKSKDDEDDAFDGIEKPDDFKLNVLSPFEDDDEGSEDYTHNDLSLIIKFEVSGKTILYTGDSCSKYWQDRIIPDLLEDSDYNDWAEAEILEVGHHGSYDFFGEDRESVRDEDDEPDNYEALDRIKPDDLIISAKNKFPLNGDSSGEDPPHYAAWKWYHKWFRDNHEVEEDDKHPEQYKYTSEGNVRLEFEDNNWKWVEDWDHNKQAIIHEAKKLNKKHQNQGVVVGDGLEVKKTRFYGEI